LQPGAEGARHPVELAEADRLAHAMECRPIAEFDHLPVDQVADGLVLLVVDFRGNAGRIALQPDFFHGPSSSASDASILRV
jgi:hypothetical protein